MPTTKGQSGGGAAGYDSSITVFSPEGRLHQLDYAFQAVKLAGFTTIAVRGDENIFVVTGRKSTDGKLRDKTSCSHMFAITKWLGLVATGIQADGRALAHEARKEAADFRLKWGYEMPPHVLAQWIAARSQIRTQHASMRPYGIVSMIVGVDEEKGNLQLFTCDPAGQVFGYKAVSAGLKESEIMNFLEVALMIHPSLSPQTIYKMALFALEYVCRGDPGVWELEIFERSDWTVFRFRAGGVEGGTKQSGQQPVLRTFYAICKCKQEAAQPAAQSGPEAHLVGLTAIPPYMPLIL